MDCTWVTARTQCSESDGALYDAHIRAVKLQAKTTGKAEVDLFHNLCWGHGKVALGRYSSIRPSLTARMPRISREELCLCNSQARKKKELRHDKVRQTKALDCCAPG